jgi:putative nucleotidyltransferase with HDIG domain
VKTISVETGGREISRSDDLILEAHLGTCVGVALWDPVAGVGGMAHFLLPEPISHDHYSYPFRYAATGLPLLLEELLALGAERVSLRAAFAGGAYVGDISDWDAALDIGGRTIELVERVLSQEKVTVARYETGGFFTCRLCLDCRSWTPDIQSFLPMKKEPSSAEPLQLDIEEVTDGLEPIPQIALRIIRMINEEKHDLFHVASEVRKDQAISAKVIQLCNSGFFHRGSNIDSIDRALVVMGDRGLLNLVASASLQHYFPNTTGGYSLSKGGLYQHSLGVAQLAEQIARHTSGMAPDVAYTAGLLHDIGKAALDQHLGGAASLLYQRTQEEGQTLLQAEKELLGATHTWVGAVLASRWELPASLARVIEHHHTPEDAGEDDMLTHIVYFADLLMSRLKVGQEMERMDTSRLGQRLARLGLEPSGFSSLVDSLTLNLLGD